MLDLARGYPKELAQRVRASWPAGAAPLPASLEPLLDVAYHASFLREEERPVTCRILVAPAEVFPVDAGPPSGLLPLAFDARRAYDEQELRGLSHAADMHRAFVAIDERDGVPSIWGIVQSGPRWLQVAQGGRAVEPPVPPHLVIRVVRPGHLLVGCGGRLVAELRGGRLSDRVLDVLQARWLSERFRDVRAQLVAEHTSSASPALPSEPAAELAAHLAQQTIKRIVATMRASHHGGTLVIGPPSCLAERHLHAKYSFPEGAARRRFRRLVLAILGAVAVDAQATSRSALDVYRAETDAGVAELDEGLFELGHLVASLAAVDGAVVLSKRLEILGFGAEIAGSLPPVTEVRRALDLDADEFVVEGVDGVGTRHRSAFRLCAASPDTLAIVVSHDGGVRFVAAHRGALTYWDQGLGAD